MRSTPTGAELTDGTRVEADAIIAATGYRRGLEPLVGHLGVLDERGLPRVHGGDRLRPACASSATCLARADPPHGQGGEAGGAVGQE